MASARDLRVAPIDRVDADRLIRRLHYSGKVVQNSQLHFGVFIDGQLEGTLQFGPSMDKTKLIGLVSGTPWHGFIELNRLAFSERLPRNSESRALGVAMRLFRKRYLHLQWVVSFADATCCGDGAIYRASGFVLTGIQPNKQVVVFPDGLMVARMTLEAHCGDRPVLEICRRLGIEHKYRTIQEWKKVGARLMDGFQLRYIYFLHADARDRLTVPVLPFSEIDRIGAGMYRGERREKQAMAENHLAQRRGGTDLRAPFEEAA